MVHVEPTADHLPQTPASVRRQSALQRAMCRAQDLVLVPLLVRGRWPGAFLNLAPATLDEEPRQDPLDSMRDRR